MDMDLEVLNQTTQKILVRLLYLHIGASLNRGTPIETPKKYSPGYRGPHVVSRFSFGLQQPAKRTQSRYDAAYGLSLGFKVSQTLSMQNNSPKPINSQKGHHFTLRFRV